MVVALSPAAPWPSTIAVVTVPWPRNERSAVAGAKTTSYAENVVALAERTQARGARGAARATRAASSARAPAPTCSSSSTEPLVTPPLSSGCLAGITRELLLEWAAKEGLPVEERPLPLAVLETAQDVVLTSSTRDVQPVATVDGRDLAGGELGRAAAQLFARHAAEGLDP